jgi:hypothetical protein
MSSSPLTTVSVEPGVLVRPGLLELFEQVTEPRARRGVRHRFASLLAVALAAVLGGARSFTAIDGKTVRGAKAAANVAPHLVAALDHTLGVVLGQVQVAVKSNEIPALRTLLDAFDLVGAVVTADAMHAQIATAAYITGRGGHYVLTAKGNQASLRARCKGLPWAKIGATSVLDRRHGRRVRRTIKVTAAPTRTAGLLRCGPGRPDPTHQHRRGQEEHRGRLRHHFDDLRAGIP